MMRHVWSLINRACSRRRTPPPEDTTLMKMLISLLPVLVMSLRAAGVHGVAGPLLTFEDTDPHTGESVTCDRCPPGMYLRAQCTSTRRSECAPCPSGSFTELWNYIGKCLRCGVCGHNQVVKKECSADSDCQCACKQGYFYEAKYDMCLRHSECPLGQGVRASGTPDQDTACYTCPNGTFSDIVSAEQNCTEHRSCEAEGQQLVLRGSTWHDTVCSSCEELASRDGADYLRQILPSFFVHQKMSVRRLRQVVHRLPSADGSRQPAASGLSLFELQQRINTWISSATAGQIRQLPAVLKKTGANGAGEKLENKLQRIDSRLLELCDQRNEVDVVVMSGL